MSEPLHGPEVLTLEHDVSGFRCGCRSLDGFLTRFALENQKGGRCRTYVIARGSKVVGYYSLAPGSVVPASVTARVAAGQGPQDIPVLLIARLAVDLAEQGSGLGSHLLLDSLRRCVAGADVIGGRVVIVHAIDESARDFYLAHDFEPSPTGRNDLMLLLKDLRRALRADG